MDYNEKQEMKDTINLICMILCLAAVFVLILNLTQTF